MEITFVCVQVVRQSVSVVGSQYCPQILSSPGKIICSQGETICSPGELFAAQANIFAAQASLFAARRALFAAQAGIIWRGMVPDVSLVAQQKSAYLQAFHHVGLSATRQIHQDATCVIPAKIDK
jgi:hypothetical protein